MWLTQRCSAGPRLDYLDACRLIGVQRGLPAHPAGGWQATSEPLLAAHRSGILQVAIARSSDYYGPGGAKSVVSDILFGAVAKGKRARWLGRLDVLHSLN